MSTPTADATAEGELMLRIASGDAHALGDLYRRYGRLVRIVLLRSTPAHASHEADDLCQEVFLAIRGAAARYRHTGNLRAWICGVATRTARTARRNHALRRALRLRFGETSRPLVVEEPHDARIDARRQVTQALALLSAGQREVLLLHLFEKLSSEEIAHALGISVKTVWTRLHRARAAMQVALGGEAVTSAISGEPGETP